MNQLRKIPPWQTPTPWHIWIREQLAALAWHWEEIEAPERNPEELARWLDAHPIQTSSRDRYGMKGILGRG